MAICGSLDQPERQLNMEVRSGPGLRRDNSLHDKSSYYIHVWIRFSGFGRSLVYCT